jgi:hypothetical protein
MAAMRLGFTAKRYPRDPPNGWVSDGEPRRPTAIVAGAVVAAATAAPTVS